MKFLPKIEFQNIFPIILSLALFILFVFIFQTNSRFVDGSDEIYHFLISKYSWQHPELLLDLWGKTLFTLLSGPFSQFGFVGLQLFNSGVGVLAAYIAYVIAKKINLHHAWLVIVLVLFTPIYFLAVPSGLTEVLFSFMIVTSISLFLHQKYFLSAVVISFIPLARNEGFVFFPLFIAAYLGVKQYKTIPLVLFGLIFYGCITLVIKHDFFYFFTQSPYQLDTYAVYGKGSLGHFFVNRNYLFKPIVEVLFWIGVVASFRDILIHQGQKKIHIITEVLLIVGIFFTYIIAHSVVWWLGIGRSLGLLRVMAGVAPLSALIALRGLNALLYTGRKYLHPRVSFLLVIAVSFYAIFTAFSPATLALLESPNERTVLQTATTWYSNHFSPPRKVYYFDPFIPYYLNKDPFNPKEAQPMNKTTLCVVQN